MAILNGYYADMKVSVAEAKNRLTKLIKTVEGGGEVTICRRGHAVVDLVRTAKGAPEKPRFGTLRGKITFHDPDWWKPLTEEELDAFLEGRA